MITYVRFIVGLTLIFLSTSSFGGRWSNLVIEPRIGPIELTSMTLDQLSAVINQKIVPCSMTNEEVLEFAKTYGNWSVCGWEERNREFELGNSISVSHKYYSTKMKSDQVVTRVVGQTEKMSDEVKQLAYDGTDFFNIYFDIYDGFLANVAIKYPRTNLKYLTQKYGQPEVDDQTKPRQCLNSDGFVETSNFGTVWYRWGPDVINMMIQASHEIDYDEFNKTCRTDPDPDLITWYTLSNVGRTRHKKSRIEEIRKLGSQKTENPNF